MAFRRSISTEAATGGVTKKSIFKNFGKFWENTCATTFFCIS